MTTKDSLHNLVDQLPEAELPAAERYLEYLRDRGDPFIAALREALRDDEPETPQERKAVQAAWKEYQRGQARPWEEARRELERVDNIL